MKPQDLLFLLILIVLLYKKKPDLFVWAGIISLVVSMPLFAKWVFFTAERLVLYAALFFLVSILLNLKTIRDNK